MHETGQGHHMPGMHAHVQPLGDSPYHSKRLLSPGPPGDSVSSNADPQTMVLHGAKDPICLSEHPEWFHKHIPGDGNTSLHILQEGKHNLHIRFADEVNALIRNFLK